MTTSYSDCFNGILLVDKPVGPTSHDVVHKIRKTFKIAKVGHGGTLDPNATGLLIILLGKGTKFSDQIMGSDKAYSGVMRLGRVTSSQDCDGEILEEHPFEHITQEQVAGEMKKLEGDIYQMPPMVSAIKMNGVPLYKLARKGEVKLDFTNFDREGKRYFDDRQAFSAFNFAPYLWTRNNDKVVPLISDTKGTVVVRQKPDGSIDPLFEKVVIGVFRGIADHLAKKGWLDRAIYYVTDEPGDDDMQGIKDICMLIRKADPRIRTSLTYDPANRPKLAELIDDKGKSLISVWVPYCTMYKQEVADDQRRKGADYWLYDVSTTCLIGMSAQTNRSIMWDTWRKGCHGYLYYLSTYWGQDFTPWDRPSFLLPGVSYRYKQGDGYFFYPPQRKYDPEKPILDHVVPTIRWEMLREGAEDYDYLAMLQNLTQRAEKRKLKAAVEGKAAMKLASEISEAMSGLMDGCSIRDLVFKPTDGWTFGLEEGWMQCSGGKQIDLPISFKTSLPDGRYRLILSAYSDQSYRDLPYSKFLVNGKQYASPVGFTGPSNIATDVVSVKNHKCEFVLSSVAEKYGVIIYQVGLQKAVLGERSSLYSVRAKVADAIEHLQVALRARK
jgi:hypothetical protein